MYKFQELSETAKKRAIKEYKDGWKETHPEDNLSNQDVKEILLDDDALYNQKGKYQE